MRRKIFISLSYAMELGHRRVDQLAENLRYDRERRSEYYVYWHHIICTGSCQSFLRAFLSARSREVLRRGLVCPRQLPGAIRIAAFQISVLLDFAVSCGTMRDTPHLFPSVRSRAPSNSNTFQRSPFAPIPSAVSAFTQTTQSYVL